MGRRGLTVLGRITPLSYRGRVLTPVCWSLTHDPEDYGSAVLEAWTEPEGPDGPRLSTLPCPTRVERWSDGGWRVAGQRTPRRTATQAVEDYLHDLEGAPARFRAPWAVRRPYIRQEDTECLTQD